MNKTACLLLLLTPALGLAQILQEAPAVKMGQPPEFDQAVALLKASKEVTDGYRDYKARFVRQEKVGKALLPEQVITLSVRVRPFAVRMVWQAPNSMRNQEAIYDTTVSKITLEARAAKGLAKLTGFNRIPLNDRRVLEVSRHTIDQAGIHALTDRILAQWEKDRKIGPVTVKIEDHSRIGKDCVRIEMTKDRKHKDHHCWNSVTILEKDSKRLVYVEYRAMPTVNSKQESGVPDRLRGEMFERYGYEDLQPNVGLTGSHFR